MRWGDETVGTALGLGIRMFDFCTARSFISDRTSPSRSYQTSAHRSPSLLDFCGSCGNVAGRPGLKAVAEQAAG